MTPDPNPAEVEVVARAIHDAKYPHLTWPHGSDAHVEEYNRIACAAIQALDACRATLAKTDTHVADIARVKAEAWDEGAEAQFYTSDRLSFDPENNPYRATILRPDAPQITGSGVGDE